MNNMSELPEIVILRPTEQATLDMMVCQQLNWQPILMSPMQLSAQNHAIAKLPERFKQADVIFWVSPSAVDFAKVHLAAMPKQVIQVAVGRATAQRLNDLGIKKVCFPMQQSDSEAVFELPLWQKMLQQIPLPKLLIIRGVGGREWLAQSLRAIGWQVDYAEIYTRTPLALVWSVLESSLLRGTLRAVYVTTVATAVMWCEQMPIIWQNELCQLVYLCSHPKVAQVFKQYGMKYVKVGDLTSGLPTIYTEGV